MFGHEKLEAYQFSIRFIAEYSKILSSLPAGNAYLIDQFRRASASSALNIAEGSGRRSELDKKRYYLIARGSAMECAAILDVFQAMDLINKDVVNNGKNVLNSVVGILTSICRK